MDSELIFIGDLVEAREGAIRILREYGIDGYRLKDVTIRDASERYHFDAANILLQIAKLPTIGRPAPKSARALIGHIQERFHHPHLNKLFTALRLSRRLEADVADFPKSLSAHLKCLAELIDEHQAKEKDTVFPAILFSHSRNLRFPIFRVMLEHEEIAEELDTVSRLTQDYVAPPGAPEGWTLLYALLAKLDESIRFHIYLENAHLYAPFSAGRAAA